MPPRPHRRLSVAACSVLLALPLAGWAQERLDASRAANEPAPSADPALPASPAPETAPAPSLTPEAVPGPTSETTSIEEAAPAVITEASPPAEAQAPAVLATEIQVQAAAPPASPVLKLDLSGVSRLQDVDVGSPSWAAPTRPSRPSAAEPDPRDRNLAAERERSRASDLRPLTPGAPEPAPVVRFKRKF